MSLDLTKKEFMALLANGAPTKRPASTKANWEKIIQDCKDAQGDEPFTKRDFWEIYVKGVVTSQRAKSKLDQLYVQGKLQRIVYDGAYYYMWNLPELT